MNSAITTLDPRINSFTAKTILSEAGYQGSLLTLAPGDETSPRAINREADHLLFVIEGEATVRRGGVNTVLGQDQALLIREGEEPILAAAAGGETKILRLEIPPRRVVTPQIITPGR